VCATNAAYCSAGSGLSLFQMTLARSQPSVARRQITTSGRSLVSYGRLIHRRGASKETTDSY
jgi:hypothetical protein